MLSIFISRHLQVFLFAVLLVMSALAVRDLRNSEPALLTFNVESTRAGQLKVLYEKDGVLVDPGWLIPLREGVTQRAEFPLTEGSYKLLGFKPFSAGEVRMSLPTVRIQETEQPLGGGFVAINQLEVLPAITNGVAIRETAGATDPFGVYHGLNVHVPPGRLTAIGFIKVLAKKLLLVAIAFALLFLVFGRSFLSAVSDIQRTSTPGKERFFGIIAFGVFVLYLRNAHSLLHPILYTEDGAWMAGLFDRGFWDMFFNAKGGHSRYFVFINILILQLAKSTNTLFVGHSIAYLPHLVSFYTTVFYALLAAAPLYLLRFVMRFEARVVLWGLILMMPLGTASFEVLGRASNVGYGILFLAFCLLVYRRSFSAGNAAHIYGIDVLLFLCANTNPLCYPLIFLDFSMQAYALRNSWFGPQSKSFIKTPFVQSAIVLGLSLTICATWVLLREKGGDSFLGGDLKYDRLTEMIFARSFLYVVVFPIYGYLSNSSAILLSIVLILLLLWLTRGASTKERKFIASISGVFICATTATIYGRPGLTNYLNAYSSTHLDRYYFGLSLFVALMLCAAFSSALSQNIRIKSLVVSFLGGSLIALYLGNTAYFFEFDKPRWNDLPQEDFRDSLAKAYVDPGAAEAGALGTRYKVDLHPKPWITHFPGKNVVATLLDKRGFVGEIPHSKSRTQAELASPVAKYEGKVVRQHPQNRGREDGWFLVKEGRRSWISDPRWLERNGIPFSNVIEISSEDFASIPDSGDVLN